MGDKWAENWAWEPKLPECSERDGRGQLEEGSLGVEDLGGSWRILEDLRGSWRISGLGCWGRVTGGGFGEGPHAPGGQQESCNVSPQRRRNARKPW